MPNKKTYFNKNEKAILKVIYDSRRFMTIRDIAKKADLSWVTTRKYLKKLQEKGYVKEK